MDLISDQMAAQRMMMLHGAPAIAAVVLVLAVAADDDSSFSSLDQLIVIFIWTKGETGNGNERET